MSAYCPPLRRFILARLPHLVAFVLLACALPSWASDKTAVVKPPEPMEFLVNIKRDDYRRGILRIAIVLEYADSRLAAHFLRFKPKLMHQILLVLSEQASEVLLSNKGKIELKRQIVKEINQAFRETEPSAVKDALITDFFVQ
ncbi:flagellar basal body-associated FliL family protein [Propionivibrio dicarboxylicus]|uniref:Flagellar protein FliL n=1 Tax=Propionivibrio dicarboxylicus TaxID=83767 RepID=A0A1G8GYN4_9RHOO|nr:flagellar basal body-associated FliL family protein [Propionivibrio dicarboxylicus]SDH99508.1 Flagellar basal body-associated protein FliL [Propionivibrio dicarboxylicus]